MPPFSSNELSKKQCQHLSKCYWLFKEKKNKLKPYSTSNTKVSSKQTTNLNIYNESSQDFQTISIFYGYSIQAKQKSGSYKRHTKQLENLMNNGINLFNKRAFHDYSLKSISNLHLYLYHQPQCLFLLSLKRI